MSNSQSETDELEILKREAAELRAQRKRQRSEAESAAEETSKTMEERHGTEPPLQDASARKRLSEWDRTIDDLTAHIERLAKNIEEALKERPELGLLVAFAGGIAVGYLLSRRNV